MSLSNFPTHLPPPPNVILRHGNMQAAYRMLSDYYEHALRVLQQDAPDPVQISFHIDALTSGAMPVLEGIEQEVETSGMNLPNQWLIQCANFLGDMVGRLRHIKELAQGKEDGKILFPEVVTEVKSGRPGRPKKIIDLDFLRAATAADRQISIPELAKSIGIHRNTLSLFMKKQGLCPRQRYSTLSNHDLDIVVKTFKSQRPESGFRYLMGFLRRRNLRIQHRRVVGALRRVDALGQRLRVRKVTRRRKYLSRRPNAIWHLDGHHKLIRWGIVIHGIVDGYCRTVTGLRASTNNQGTTVLELFLDAVDEFGMPSRARGDRGGENVPTAVYIVIRNGRNRASFIWGTSTHNTRIERMWVEVATQFVRRWRAFFLRLEQQHGLDPERPEHLWLLHTLFLDAINNDCKQFQNEWNSHPIAGPETKNKSPNDLRFLGQIQHGIYRSNVQGIHPNTRSEASTGDIANDIHEEQRSYIRHEGICVPDHRNPFMDQESEAQYLLALHELVERDFVPAGYGLREEEWEDNSYPLFETLPLGKRNGKSICISLEDPIWLRRAILWGQAVNLLSRFVQ